MFQFNDEHSTAIESKGLFPKKIGDNILVVGKHKLKYLTSKRRDADFERQIKNN